ncbi:hypothetical protein ACFFX0_21235 [Citricoccus parietis]|uniref:Uncharacterized protein n=1 Tax=Citricoccus parietis TaxID=592307 RepID=A0ABV5G3S6_9MICC
MDLVLPGWLDLQDLVGAGRGAGHDHGGLLWAGAISEFGYLVLPYRHGCPGPQYGGNSITHQNLLGRPSN